MTLSESRLIRGQWLWLCVGEDFLRLEVIGKTILYFIAEELKIVSQHGQYERELFSCHTSSFYIAEMLELNYGWICNPMCYHF